ncbi:MAG: hypothetical protein MUO31_07990 [Thermodesulfovibrionales bacterium]|nr:hypothetical protein [Thermodesulfovibrionales bacterium]
MHRLIFQVHGLDLAVLESEDFREDCIPVCVCRVQKNRFCFEKIRPDYGIFFSVEIYCDQPAEILTLFAVGFPPAGFAQINFISAFYYEQIIVIVIHVVDGMEMIISRFQPIQGPLIPEKKLLSIGELLNKKTASLVIKFQVEAVSAVPVVNKNVIAVALQQTVAGQFISEHGLPPCGWMVFLHEKTEKEKQDKQGSEFDEFA